MQQELPITATEADRLASERDAAEWTARLERRRADRRARRGFATTRLRIPLLLPVRDGLVPTVAGTTALPFIPWFKQALLRRGFEGRASAPSTGVRRPSEGNPLAIGDMPEPWS